MSLDQAILWALENPIKQRGRNSISRFGAVLSHTKKPKMPFVFYGWNSYKTHPLVKKFSNNENLVCVHAEMSAILDYVHCMRYNGQKVYNLSEYTMYVARVLKDGTPALAKPCTACQNALIHFGIGDCKWTT